MIRHTHSARANWQQLVEQDGMIFHTPNDERYWDESVSYQFSMDQALKIESVTNQLYSMCMDAVQYVIDNNLYRKFRIPQQFIRLIEDSWNADHPSVYGRFDFSWDGKGEPKMLEYNADTPTSLLEAAIVQHSWLNQVHPNSDQLNSLHERLVYQWKFVRQYLEGNLLHFACLPDTAEDRMTVAYLQETAEEAGLQTKFLYVHEIGWNENQTDFRDVEEVEIDNIFKLYPWEWMVHEEFGSNVLRDDTLWFEPPWKMILSNKALLPILWEMFPDHPNLLPAYFEEEKYKLGGNYAKKPIFSREGANVELVKNGQSIVSTSGEYGEEGHIYQALHELPNFDGNYPVLGLWIIGDECGGMGIREDNQLVTTNLSRFVPHFIK